MIPIMGLIASLLTALPSIITGIEAAFHHLPKSGPSKWIGVETSLAMPIQALAGLVAKTVPNANADKIALQVATLVKAVNDAIVAFYNSAGWPTQVQ